MSELVRYDAACRAVAECISIDEAKDLRDKAEAMRAYARQAKNKNLEVDAAEIRMRAERRLGEILLTAKDAGQVVEGRPRNCSDEEQFPRVRLDDAGIDRKLSSRAQKIAAVPDAQFEGMIGDWRERVSQENERVSVALLTEGDKAQRRADRERVLGGLQHALPNKRYGVILADPEWRFEVYSRETGMDRAADNHYPTSTTDVICERDVGSIAADDCVLFLWATAPMLPDAFRVMEAWGFTYKSHIIWHKDRIGTGYWFRNCHELLLVGTRGDVPAPAMGTQSPSVLSAPVTTHSTKPENFLELIEKHYPTLPKIELNRRGPSRAGWDAWGNESEGERDVA